MCLLLSKVSIIAKDNVSRAISESKLLSCVSEKVYTNKLLNTLRDSPIPRNNLAHKTRE